MVLTIPSPSRTGVKEIVDIYLYSISVPSWQVIRRISPFFYFFYMKSEGLLVVNANLLRCDLPNYMALHPRL
jgi:hypothetical protein